MISDYLGGVVIVGFALSLILAAALLMPFLGVLWLFGYRGMRVLVATKE